MTTPSPRSHERQPQPQPAPLVVHASAKLNLTLEVLGRRPDGYHALRSVMQKLALGDTLTLSPAEGIALRCSDPAIEGPDNLAWRAADLLRRETGCVHGVAIHLEKRIPVAAGLGGGSSDAAATLCGLNRLWRLGLPDEHLADLGAQIGSDVPFFIGDHACALVEGRGERVTPRDALPRRHVVLVKPGPGISAGAVYRALPRERWSDGSRTTAWLDTARREATVPAPFNDLEPVALAVEPAAAAARDALLAAGAAAPLMSGSGSTYFALCHTAEAAAALAARLRAGGWAELYVTEFAGSPPPRDTRRA